MSPTAACYYDTCIPPAGCNAIFLLVKHDRFIIMHALPGYIAIRSTVKYACRFTAYLLSKMHWHPHKKIPAFLGAQK